MSGEKDKRRTTDLVEGALDALSRCRERAKKQIVNTQVLHVLDALQTSPKAPPAAAADVGRDASQNFSPRGVERGTSSELGGPSSANGSGKPEARSKSPRKVEDAALDAVQDVPNVPPSISATERAVSRIATTGNDATKAHREETPTASSPASGPATDALAKAQAESATLAEQLSKAEAEAMTVKMTLKKAQQEAAEWRAKAAEFQRRAEESEKKLAQVEACFEAEKVEKAALQGEVDRLKDELADLSKEEAAPTSTEPTGAEASGAASIPATNETPDGVFDESRPTFDEDEAPPGLSDYDLGDSYRPTMGERPSMAEVLDACDMSDFVDRMSEYAEDVEEILELEDGDYDDMGVSEEQRALLKEAVEEVAATGRLTLTMTGPLDLGPELPSLERVLFVANLMRVFPLLADLGIESTEDLLGFLEDDQANGFEELGLETAGTGDADPANLDESISVDDEVEGCDRHGNDVQYERTRLLRAAREAVSGDLEAYYAKGSKWWDKSDETDDVQERSRNESNLIQAIAGIGFSASRQGEDNGAERTLETQSSATDFATQEDLDRREALAGEMNDDCHLQRVPLSNTHTTAGDKKGKGKRRSSILHIPTVLANSRKMGSAYESAARWAAERVLYMEKRGVLTPFEAQLLLHEIAVPNSAVIKLCTSGKAVAILDEVTHLNEEHNAEHALVGDGTRGLKRPSSSRELKTEAAASKVQASPSEAARPKLERRGSDIMEERGKGGGSALHPGLARKTSIPLLAAMKDVTPTVDSPRAGAVRKSSVTGAGSPDVRSILKDTSAGDATRSERADSSLSDTSFRLDGHASPTSDESRDGAAEASEGAKSVSFSMVQIRYYSYRVGQGVPSDGGPAIGLSWHYSETLTDTLTIDEAEDIAESSNRLSAKDFGCKGYLRLEDRIRKLSTQSAGHRRSSIDLCAYQAQCENNSRRLSAMLPGSRLIMQGVAPSDAQRIDQEAHAAILIRPFYIAWLERSAKTSSDPFVFMAKSKLVQKLKSKQNKSKAGSAVKKMTKPKPKPAAQPPKAPAGGEKPAWLKRSDRRSFGS